MFELVSSIFDLTSDNFYILQNKNCHLRLFFKPSRFFLSCEIVTYDQTLSNIEILESDIAQDLDTFLQRYLV